MDLMSSSSLGIYRVKECIMLCTACIFRPKGVILLDDLRVLVFYLFFNNSGTSQITRFYKDTKFGRSYIDFLYMHQQILLDLFSSNQEPIK